MPQEPAPGDIRLIAIDLDGTLLTSAGTLPPEGAHLLRRAAQAGTHVVLATTRTPDSTLPFCRALELTAPLICANGALVWGSPDGPVWASHTIPLDAARAIADLADRNGWELSTTVGETTYLRQRPGQALGPLAPHVTVAARNADALVGEPFRILTWQPDAVAGILRLCEARFADQCATVIYHKPDGRPHSLGVFALQANKSTALALVLDRLGLTPQQVMAIGDDHNDLPLFSRVRVRVAMGNAAAEVKAQATLVAPGNDDEGVAWALRTCGLG